MDSRLVTCTSCEHPFRVPATVTAPKVRCPKCKAVVELQPAAPVAAARRSGASAARAGAARARAKPADDVEAESSGVPHRHARHRRPAARKKSPMPLVLGGVALVAVLAGVATLMGGDAEKPKAAPPAVVVKPDFADLADLERAEGTSDETWADLQEQMAKYITPPFGKASERSGDLTMHKGKRAIPAILNAYKRLDFTTQDGTDIGWKMQTLMLQGLTGGVDLGWHRGTLAEDVAFNAAVIRRWFDAWNEAKLDDVAWAEIAKQSAAPAANQ